MSRRIRATKAWIGTLVSLAASQTALGVCVLPVDHQFKINIEACGASPDSLDNKSSIDDALEAAKGRYAGVYVPAGVFLTSGHHLLPAHVGLFGNGTLKLLRTGDAGPIVSTSSSHNLIDGVTFDLSASVAASRLAIDIDGGSEDVVVQNVTIKSGRIISFVTNAGPSPTRIDIRSNTIFSARTGGTSGGAIDINSGTSHFAVVANRIDGNWDGKRSDEMAGDGAGIDVESNASHGQITQNDTYANAGNGIFVLSGEYMSISDNNSSGNRQAGIGINSFVTPRPGGISIIGNVCDKNLYDGIDVNEVGPLQHIHVSITGNHLASNGPSPEGGGTGIILAYAADVAISGNTIIENSVAGIWLYFSEKNLINGNIISGNSRTNPGSNPGVLLVDSPTNIVSNNLLSGDDNAPTQSFGIEERGATTDNNLYVGNHLRTSLKGSIKLSGRHSVRSHNFSGSAP